MERAWITCLWLFVAVFWPSVSASPFDDSVAQRLDALESYQLRSEKEIYELRQLTAEQQTVIHEQGNLIRELRQQNDELTSRIASNAVIQKQVETLNAALSTEEKQMENKLENEITQNKGMNAPVQYNIQENHTDKSISSVGVLLTPSTQYRKPNRISKRQVSVGGAAFSAYLDHDMTTNLGTIIRFNKVITNERNAFSIHTGVFTCPENGLYLLSFAVGQRDAGELYAKLMVNSVNIIDAVVQGYHATQDLQGGNTVVIRLNTGDAVWIEGTYSGGHVEGSEFRITSFTGVYLHE